ncbi:glycosyltransferase [Tardiphaga sp. 215_C5_N2_1]|uniref:glycosyltransferase n=1 Tax=Tardiphaga sp. 215_C5_N2_1 TaxID=3240774 RepID=UPI003F8A8C4C
MRILHSYKIYRPDIEGGIPAVISHLTAGARSGEEHSILCARRSGTARSYTIDGTAVEAVASLGTLFSMPLAPAYIPILIGHTRTADLVVHHAPFPLNDAAILLGLPKHVALVVYWHADIVGYSLLKKLVSPMLRSVLARADRIVVSGQPIIDGSEFLRPHAGKCVIMPYGMDLEYWRKASPENTAIAGEQQAMPRHIVCLGRLVGYKGYDVLLHAMRQIDGHATIIGEGPLLSNLQKLAIELGVADRIRFAGRLERDEIHRLFHAAQVFAFPSVTDAEAFGIVQVEAMAAGLPVVNTMLTTTVPLVARHGKEALTVPPRNAQALASALNRILDDPAFAQRLGSAGQARAFEEFDQRTFRLRMALVYADALLARRSSLAAKS